jgi:hypothetical protein
LLGATLSSGVQRCRKPGEPRPVAGLDPAEPRFAALLEAGSGPQAPRGAKKGTDAAAASPIRDPSRERPSAFGPTVVRPRRPDAGAANVTSGSPAKDDRDSGRSPGASTNKQHLFVVG